MADWTLALHGGAGIIDRATLTAEQDAGARRALGRALDAGVAVLAAGGSALDAVEAAVFVLEDDPHFNAGRGAVLAYDGTVQLDAAIMDGRDRNAGAVAGVSGIRHPVAAARAVMERSPHVLLAGSGADEFARGIDIEPAPAGWFDLPERREQLAAMKAKGDAWFDVDMKFGTVGAIARDQDGHLAAATSTGGVTAKRWGRIGDSPIVGAGTLADDRACAVSATGSGEFFLRASVAHEIGARVRLLGEEPRVAAGVAMAEVKAMGGSGGVIVAGVTGAALWSFTTAGMYRASASSTGDRRIAIYADEDA